MKRHIVLLITLLAYLPIFCGPVSRDLAMKQAAAFVNDKYAKKAKMGLKLASKSTALQTVAESPYYYVFNIGSNGGFVIVSGDDRTEQILGYTDEGSFNPDSIPENMRWWLGEYEQQIKQVEDSGEVCMTDTGTAKKMMKAVVATKNPVSPLLQTKWDQGNPYWKQCPVSDGNGCYTGCVATAMAQIMYYHHCPSWGTEVIPAYTSSSLGVKMAELPSVNFDWDDMLTTYSGSEDSLHTAAVAQLMLYAGQSVKMDYGTNSSTSYSALVPNALINYFGFDNTTQQVFRSAYTASEWDALIYSELANARPVYYTGSSLAGGHAFVCDGYDEGGYYHINWGWGGYGNGYFLLSVMNPWFLGVGGGSSADGFSLNQTAIIGMKPMTFGFSSEKVVLSISSMSVVGAATFTRNSASDDFAGVGIRTKVRCNLESTYNVSFGLGLYNDGSLVKVLKSADGGSCANGGSYDYTFSDLSFGAGLTPGVYDIKPISKESSADTWLEDDGAGVRHVRVVVTDTQLTLTAYPYYDMNVNSVTFTSNLAKDYTQEIVVNVTNNGSEYNGIFKIFTNQGAAETLVAANGVVVCEGETEDLYFHYTPSASGDYHVVLKRVTDEGTYAVLYTTQVTILDEIPAATANLKFAVTMKNINTPNNYVEYGNSFKYILSVTNQGTTAYNSYIQSVLYKKNGSGVSYLKYYSVNVNIASGETKNIDFEFNGLNYGSQYSIRVAYKDNGSNTYWSDELWHMYTMTKGVKTWLKDGSECYSAMASALTIGSDAVAVDLQGLTDVASVAPNDNPNCLYYTDATAPSGLDSRNVITGGTAASVAFVDGHDMFVPEEFTASHITYSRTFTAGADGTGVNWNTIVLPFNTSTLTNTTDGKSEDWFHSSGETGKSVWIKDFVAEDGDVVCFGYADKELKANHPYIIAVAGNKWGEEWNLVGKTMTFSAESVTVPVTNKLKTEGSTYDFIGSEATKTMSDVFYLNEQGSGFVSYATKDVEPFRAYFCSVAGTTSNAKQLFIGGFDDTATPVKSIVADSHDSHDVYSISGVRVRSNTDINSCIPSLHRGVYVVNGRKIIVK